MTQSKPVPVQDTLKADTKVFSATAYAQQRRMEHGILPKLNK